MAAVKNLTIRISDELHEQLVKLAEKEHRSLNGQVTACIENCIRVALKEPEKSQHPVP